MKYRATIECVCTFSIEVNASNKEEAKENAIDLICDRTPYEYRNIHNVYLDAIDGDLKKVKRK